jgi:hypothetical protein
MTPIPLSIRNQIKAYKQGKTIKDTPIKEDTVGVKYEKVLRRSLKAILVKFPGDLIVWLPKALLKSNSKTHIMTMPKWLAVNKGLIK